MRIIAGSAKGSAIFAPKGQDTRPTQDRVRESLFNILQAWVPEAEVLDLFAGSGALSLEALSRGAANAVAVDQGREAAACIRRNVEKLGFAHCLTLLPCDWQAALTRLHEQGRAFDLVFLDPPYRITDTPEMCARMAELGLLNAGAMVVIEHARASVPSPDARFRLHTARGYGDTEIHFFIYGEEEEQP